MKIVVLPDGSWSPAEDFDGSVNDVMRLDVGDHLTDEQIDLFAPQWAYGSPPFLCANWPDALEAL